MLKMHASLAVHPGSWLNAEIVEPGGISLRALAQNLSVSRSALTQLLGGKSRLSPKMAMHFETAFGVRADTLLRMQAAYDLACRSAAPRSV